MRKSANSSPPVHVTGVGTRTSLGDLNDLWQATRESRSAIRDGLGPVPQNFTESLNDPLLRGNRALAFSTSAVADAMAQAGWTELNPEDGLLLATTTGQILLWDEGFVQFVRGQKNVAEFRAMFSSQPLGWLLKSLSEFLAHGGPSSLLSSACAASTQALAIGAMWIRQGRVRRCLVVGCEVLCTLTCEGFRSLQLLSKEPARPFDARRSGINLSEGAAALCLEADSERALAELSGFGFSTDGFHMTGPHPEGEGTFRAMSGALRTAGIRTADVDWVHAHGTGSQQNDAAEGLAIQRLFADFRPPVSSTKWVHGHMLAASGALETALVVRAMAENLILSTRGLETPDPNLNLNLPLSDTPAEISHVLKNTSGFGGANAALVISRPGWRKP